MLSLSICSFGINKLLKSFIINAKQPCQVEKHFSPGLPCCPHSSLRRRCWYSTDNFPDPQSSLVTQQQAAWWSPNGGRFGLGARETRRRLACVEKRRENERCYHKTMYEPSQHQPLFSPFTAAGCPWRKTFTHLGAWEEANHGLPSHKTTAAQCNCVPI